MSDNEIPVQPTTWRQIVGWAKMTDGSVHRVTTTTADRIGYGHAARKNDWPTLGSKGMDIELWQTYLIYHALYRTGVYRDSWEQFVNVDAEVVQPDEEGEEVNPTVPTP